jgi:hypothetical protein
MISRRRWLLLSAALGVAAGAALVPWRRVTTLPVSQWFSDGLDASPALKEVLLGLDGTTDIGQAWLAARDREPGLEELVDGLLNKLGDASSRQALEERLAQRIRQDHVEGETCEIHGWRLARTECEIAAVRWLAFGSLAALAATESPDDSNSAASGPETSPIIVEVTNWGPRSTEQGEPFNVQPDGHSGLWFAATNAPSWVKIVIAGTEAPTTVLDRAITSGLFGEEGYRVLSTPGSHPIELYDPVSGIRQPIGEFIVRPSAERAQLEDGTRAKSLCPVSAWGPDRTRAGVPANAQPDGSMGLWFRTPCAPTNVRLIFGEDRLPMTRSEFGLTARVPLALIETPGEHQVALFDVDTGQQMPVGLFSIQGH